MSDLSGTWRPKCYGKMFVNFLECCKDCPFKASCESWTDDYREHMGNYREWGD